MVKGPAEAGPYIDVYLLIFGIDFLGLSEFTELGG